MHVNNKDTRRAGNDLNDTSVIPFWLKALIVSVGLLAMCMLALYIKNFGATPSSRQDIWGQFGDYFGGILNPLLSSLALAAVLVTLRIQGQDLRIAQDENKQTNRHLNDQAKYIRLQTFESVFFRLLDLHINAKKEFTNIQNEQVLKGIAGFESLNEELSEFEIECLALDTTGNQGTRSSESITYRFEEKFGNQFSTYFRSMYQILKYVDSYEGFSADVELRLATLSSKNEEPGSELDSYKFEYQAKRQYVNMLRAQMEQVERRALFASCLTAKGAGLKFYVEKYSLLKGLNIQRTSLSEGQARKLYRASAFLGSEDIDYAKLKSEDEQLK